MPFLEKTILSESSDGRNDVLARALNYTSRVGELIIVPVGASTDGASIPRFLWSILPPVGADYWMPAVLHDWLYRRTQRAKGACDKLLLEAMLDHGVNKFKAEVIYCGVKYGGFLAFRDCRKAQQEVKV